MSRCRMQDCEGKIFKKGLCRKHYELKQQNKCIVEGCDGEYGVRGLCAKHYSRWKKYGDPTVVKQEQLHGVTLRDRVFRNLKSNGDCLEWTGYKDAHGYGHMSVEGVPTLVHRIAWELYNGPIPKGMCVCHHCDNPSCVRIDHLFLGTYADNNQDCIQKGRARKRGLIGEDHNLAILTEGQVMEIRASDKHVSILAEKYGVSRGTISDVQTEKSWQHLPTTAGRRDNRKHHFTEADVMTIRHSSEGSNILAKRYGVSRRTIDDARYGRTWVHLPDAKNANHGKKFTSEDVLYIRASEEKSKILAAKYEVDKSSIDNIRSRRTWTNI